jgi:hypothetical protein
MKKSYKIMLTYAIIILIATVLLFALNNYYGATARLPVFEQAVQNK